MLDPLWTHRSGSVDGSMIAINELAQTNAQISEHDQVPWSAGRNKRTLNIDYESLFSLPCLFPRLELDQQKAHTS